MYVTPFIKFGPSFKKWTSILFQNISSCVLNTGWSSEFFSVLGIFSDESSLQKTVPFLFLVARIYIHCCKWTDTKPVLNIFKIKVKKKRENRKY
jgi:hypothetical protein